MTKKITLILPVAALLPGLTALPVSAANAPFTAHVIDNAYGYCTAVSAADVNRDGKMDILSANWQGSGAIVWWQNLGNGAFSSSAKQVVSAFFAGATSPYADDLDHDGDLDVAAVSIYNRLAWFEKQDSGVRQTRTKPASTGGRTTPTAAVGARATWPAFPARPVSSAATLTATASPKSWPPAPARCPLPGSIPT